MTVASLAFAQTPATGSGAPSVTSYDGIAGTRYAVRVPSLAIASTPGTLMT